MKTSAERDKAELAILLALPGRAHDLSRLRVLSEQQLPVVTVIGKYNHGKSRLLNELIGHMAFAVADKRETIVLSEHEHAGVCWLDAPGLDADVSTGDDNRALAATWLKSDIRLFVHAAKEGELDAAERTLLESLHDDEQSSMRQTLVVLSQIDQLPDARQYANVLEALQAQLAPGVKVHPTSSTRYRQGLDGDKPLMLERSGITALLHELELAVARVPKAREHEAEVLYSETMAELVQLSSTHGALLTTMREKQVRQRKSFDVDLAEVLEKVASTIQAVLDVPGPDHSLTPDSFANQFKLTPGKLERNRLQVAYSKACISINGILIRHGASELPLEQQTTVRSLDNIMSAVMGVYVKYRKDLQEIFCTDSGRDRLRREFGRYFELSSERVELAACVAQVESRVRVVESAVTALHALKSWRASA